MNKMIIKFEPCYIGNGWGNYIDIEEYKYNIDNLQSVKNSYNNYDYYDNKNTDKNTYKTVTNLIIKVSSTTFATLILTYFVYRII